jgi:hypothetical protein
MAHVFVAEVSDEAGTRWRAHELRADAYLLRVADADTDAERTLGAMTVVLERADEVSPGDVLLLRSEHETDVGHHFCLVAAPGRGLLINGEPLASGIAVLRHRDEIRLGGRPPAYFSSERLAQIETYRDTDGPRCPRCAQTISPGDACVRCPSCEVLHHQRPDRPCWTHIERCALCQQPTDLESGLCWAPDEL